MSATEAPEPRWATHRVTNQPPPLADYDPFSADLALQEALDREGGGWGRERTRELAGILGSSEALEHARRAQRNIPVLRTHDRYGNRVDEIDYDPSMHWMLRLGVERQVNTLPWRERRDGCPRGAGVHVPPLQPAGHRDRAARSPSTTPRFRRCARTRCSQPSGWSG